MLTDVEKGSNLILTRLTPVATLIDTKQHSVTNSFSTEIVTFSWHLCNRHDARVESHTHAKRTITRKQLPAKSNIVYRTNPKILTGYSVAITKTVRQSNL